jgi:hypothetical protein
MRRTLVLLLIPLASLALAPPAGTVPIPGQTGQFGISPARRLVIATPGTELVPTIVSNTTTSTYRVSVFPALVSQGIDGSFDFAETPRNLNASKVVLTTGPDSFVLGPGGHQTVHLHWNLWPRGQPWVAVGVVFQGIPQAQGGVVHVVPRLLSINFLRLPGNFRIDGRFTGLFPQQYGPRMLEFLARVKNIGQMFASPGNEHFTIKDSTGHTVFSEPWRGTVVLPGSSVDFPIIVKRILPAGRYTATVGMDFGGHRSKTVPFTLVGPNLLPTPAVTIQDFNATGTIGSPAQLTARIISSGSAPASVNVHLFLGPQNAQPGQNALASDNVAYSNLAPSSTTALSRPLGGPLKKGSYTAVLSWKDATGAQHTLEASFTAAPARSWLRNVWNWIKHHWWVFLILLILALVAAGSYLLNKQRQRQRQIEADLAAARAALEGGAPPEPLPVPAGGIDPEGDADAIAATEPNGGDPNRGNPQAGASHADSFDPGAAGFGPNSGSESDARSSWEQSAPSPSTNRAGTARSAQVPDRGHDLLLATTPASKPASERLPEDAAAPIPGPPSEDAVPAPTPEWVPANPTPTAVPEEPAPITAMHEAAEDPVNSNPREVASASSPSSENEAQLAPASDEAQPATDEAQPAPDALDPAPPGPPTEPPAADMPPPTLPSEPPPADEVPDPAPPAPTLEAPAPKPVPAPPTAPERANPVVREAAVALVMIGVGIAGATAVRRRRKRRKGRLASLRNVRLGDLKLPSAPQLPELKAPRLPKVKPPRLPKVKPPRLPKLRRRRKRRIRIRIG